MSTLKNRNFSKYAAGWILTPILLAGCGGSGSYTYGEESFSTQGNVSSTIETAAATIPASDTSQIVSVGGVSALLPPVGAAIPAGTPLALFGTDTNPLGPMELDDSRSTRAPIGAYIWKEGQPRFFISGLVTRNGLSQPVVLTPGKWHIEMQPCYVYKIADPSNRMTMQKVLFNFVVDAQGHHSLPAYPGVWPRNGSTLKSTNVANAIVDKAFLSKPCKLTITVPGLTLIKSATYVAHTTTQAKAEFRDLFNPPTLVVPSPSGLSAVTFDSGF